MEGGEVMSIRERYRRAKEMGVCRVHPSVPAEAGTCAECRMKQSILQMNLRESRIEAGACCRCGGVRADKKTQMCERCRDKLAARYVAKKMEKL